MDEFSIPNPTPSQVPKKVPPWPLPPPWRWVSMKDVTAYPLLQKLIEENAAEQHHALLAIDEGFSYVLEFEWEQPRWRIISTVDLIVKNVGPDAGKAIPSDYHDASEKMGVAIRTKISFNGIAEQVHHHYRSTRPRLV